MKRFLILSLGLISAAIVSGCAAGPIMPVLQVANTAVTGYRLANELHPPKRIDPSPNELVVNDQSIENRTAELLRNNGRFEFLLVRAHAHRGQVFLVGLFRNRAEANLAMDLTKSVRGVRKVTGCFFLETEDAPYNRDESAMAEERIRDSLAQEKSLQDSDVDISVIQGSAVLVGTVENELDRDRLISLARAENEVLTVKPYLLVSK